MHEGTDGSYVQIGVRIGVSPWTSTSMRTLEFITIMGYPGKPSDNFFASQPIPTNTWTAFVATYDGATKTVFINGTVNVAEPYTFVPDWDRDFEGEKIGGNFPGQAESFDGMIDDIRIYNRTLSSNEVAELYAIESTPSPCVSPATATATIVDGFVVNATITDGGCGYTNAPCVLIEGGGGTGAGATAAVSNGVVVAITITNAGIGYTGTPLVVIQPPFIPNPALGIAPMSFLAFSNLTVGGVYQLQESVAWYWSNQPVSFTATNALYTQMVPGVVSSGDYRLALNPVPAQAFATPEVVNGFVVGTTVTSGGSGYVTAPAVAIVGGGGTNATAVSQISGGVVTNIAITDAGIGYTNTPRVEIAQPPAAAVSPAVFPVMRVDCANLAPYDNYQIQFEPALAGAWSNWDGGLFSPTGVTNSQYLFITNGAGFFRLEYVP
jgi:hypothetical protein